MPYPDGSDTFSPKLNNKRDGSRYSIEEKLATTAGVYEGHLAHDNIVNSTIKVYTGPLFTGTEVQNVIVSVPMETPWRRSVKIFSSEPYVYVSYETTGDTVEADDVNALQDSLTATQTELERFKSQNEVQVTELGIALSDHASAAVLDHPDKSVKTAKLDDKAVTGTKLADAAVDTPQLKDNGVTDAKIGSRTIEDSLTAASGGDTLGRLMSKLGSMIRLITGKANWYTAPTKSLEQLNTEKAPLASPAFTGIPTVPTAPVNTSTTQAASTAFVLGQAATAVPLMDGMASVGNSTRYARENHVHPTDTSRAPAVHTHTLDDISETSARKMMTDAERVKLSGIESNANNYVHPDSHPPSIIVQDASHRFVTDVEKASWTGKASTAVVTTSTNGLMSSMDKIKLEGVATGANHYVHPTGDSNQHIPATGTTNNGKVLKAGAVAGSAAWGTIAFSEIVSKPTTLSGYGITDAASASHIGSGGSSHAVATTSTSGFLSSADKTKLDGIAPGAEVNQSAFAKIKVAGQADIEAGSKTETLTLAAGTGIQITTAAGTRTATITATGGAAPSTHGASHVTGGNDVIPNAVAGGNAGLMSGADKTKLDGIAVGANLYVHPAGDGSLHVPATGTANAGKVLKAGSTAGIVAWSTVDWSDLSGRPSSLPANGGNADTVDGKHAADFMPKGPITWNQLKGV